MSYSEYKYFGVRSTWYSCTTSPAYHRGAEKTWFSHKTYFSSAPSNIILVTRHDVQVQPQISCCGGSHCMQYPCCSGRDRCPHHRRSRYTCANRCANSCTHQGPGCQEENDDDDEGWKADDDEKKSLNHDWQLILRLAVLFSRSLPSSCQSNYTLRINSSTEHLWQFNFFAVHVGRHYRTRPGLGWGFPSSQSIAAMSLYVSIVREPPPADRDCTDYDVFGTARLSMDYRRPVRDCYYARWLIPTHERWSISTRNVVISMRGKARIRHCWLSQRRPWATLAAWWRVGRFFTFPAHARRMTHPCKAVKKIEMTSMWWLDRSMRSIVCITLIWANVLEYFAWSTR